MLLDAQMNNVYIKHMIYALRSIGLWPLDLMPGAGGRPELWRCYGIVSVIGMAVLASAQMFYFYHACAVDGDLVEMTDVLCTLFTLYMTIFKMTRLIARRELFSRMIQAILKNELYEDIPISDPATKQDLELQSMGSELLKKSWNEFKAVTYVFFVLVFVTASAYSIAPIIVMGYNMQQYGTTTRLLAYKTRYPFNVYRSPFYEAASLFEAWTGYITGAAVVGVDGLLCFFLIHCCNQLKLLQFMFKQAPAEEEKSDKTSKHLHQQPISMTSQPEYKHYGILRNCVKYHIKLLAFCDDIEDVFGPINLGQFLTSSFIICLIAFQSTIQTNDFVKIAAKIPYLGAAFAQLIIYNYYGQKLINESIAIADVVYETDWYNRCPTYKTSLQMIIHKAQSPIVITAYKFSILSLESFTSILSTAMSYFTLLQTLVEKTVD